MTPLESAFFEHSPDAACIADGHFRLLAVNPALVSLLGIAREELIDRYLWQLVEEPMRETIEHVLCAFTTERVRTWRFCTQDGGLVSLTLHFGRRAQDATYFITFRQVIEDRQKDESRLAAERALIFLNATPVPMYEVDPSNTITFWNGAMTELFGIPAEEAIGKKSTDVIAWNLMPEKLQEVYRQLGSLGIARYTLAHERRAGPPIQCEWTAVRMSDGNGKTLGVIATGTDVTERARRKQEMQESLEIIRAQRDALRAVSTPILEVWGNVLALPVIGMLDEARAADMMSALLSAISARGAQFAILDLTGVVSVDAASASYLVQILQAVALLGAKGVVTGLRAQTAQMMVESGVDFQSVATFPTLRAGLRYCAAKAARA